MQGQEDCIWLLLGARSGDNAQIRAVAAHLDLPHVEMQLRYNLLHSLPNQLKGVSLGSLKSQTRTMIKPPWPRMVIASGKRSVPIARYIKEQSGGATQLVHLGRPRANLAYFDLILTTPQYGLSAEPHLTVLSVPPSSLIKLDVAAAIESHKELTQNKPRPFIVVMAGGNSTTVKFTGEAAQNLVDLALERAVDLKGSLFVLTSPRTPKNVVKILHNCLKSPAVFIAWKKPDTPPGTTNGNPYTALLAQADEVIVTSDSASMIADALELDKPVQIFQLPTGWQGHLSGAFGSIFARFDSWSKYGGVLGRIFEFWRLLRNSGLINPPRQMTLLINNLVQNGLATLLAPSSVKPCETIKSPVFSTSFDQAMDRVKMLLKN